MAAQAIELMPLVYALLGYLAFQIILNLLNGVLYRASGRKAIQLLTGAFWNGIVAALFLIVMAVVLHITGNALNELKPPPRMGMWALIGIPAGVLLWYVLVWARKLGLAIFGKSELVAAEDAILRLLPAPKYLGWGMVNLAVIQPLGRELFLRGAFLPTVALTFGWGWAIAATLVVEFVLRINVVWIFMTLSYALIMCGLYYLSGSAVCGLVAAATAGFLHGLALAYMGLRDARQKREDALSEGAGAVAGGGGPNRDVDPPNETAGR